MGKRWGRTRMVTDFTQTEGVVLLKTEGCGRCAALAKKFSAAKIHFSEMHLDVVGAPDDVMAQLLKMGASQPGMMPVVVVDGAIAIDGGKFFRPSGVPVEDPEKIIKDERVSPFRAS